MRFKRFRYDPGDMRTCAILSFEIKTPKGLLEVDIVDTAEVEVKLDGEYIVHFDTFGLQNEESIDWREADFPEIIVVQSNCDSYTIMKTKQREIVIKSIKKWLKKK